MIKDAKFSEYCFHMNTSIQGDFQISVPIGQRGKKICIYYLQLNYMTFSQSWLEESRVATNLFVAVTIKSS